MAGSTLEVILSRHELNERDLDVECSCEIGHKIALELKDWKTMGSVGFGFPLSWIATIAREQHGEDERNIALLNVWRKRNENCTCFKLAQALHSVGREDLVDKLCEAVKQNKVSIYIGDSVPQRSEGMYVDSKLRPS